jgi:hypothetical protein
VFKEAPIELIRGMAVQRKGKRFGYQLSVTGTSVLDGRRGREVGFDRAEVNPPLREKPANHFPGLAADGSAEEGPLTEMAEHPGNPEPLSTRVEVNLGGPVFLSGLNRHRETHNRGEYRHGVLVVTHVIPFARLAGAFRWRGLIYPSHAAPKRPAEPRLTPNESSHRIPVAALVFWFAGQSVTSQYGLLP